MKKTLLAAFCFLGFVVTAGAQVTSSPVSIADSLIQILLGNDNTIVVTNATLNCPSALSTGKFSSVTSNLNLQSGIVLTTGYLSDATSQNNDGGTTAPVSGPGDSDLNALTTAGTEDACILEFDMFVPGDTVKFNYVFGSEEYTSFVCSQYNDVFGFFLSGPNPLGGAYNNYNIARIPGTTLPVTINNVNCCSNYSGFYVCNDPNNEQSFSCTPACQCSVGCPNSAAGTTIGYDGFTTVLTAAARVVPCQNYHLKIAIADAGDNNLDSGVFLEAGSLQSNAVAIELGSLFADPTGNPAAVEGCDFNPEFEIRINQYTLIGDSVVGAGAIDTACFGVYVSGTAIEGVDYEFLPDTLCFYPGDTVLILPIVVIADAEAEGVETLVIALVPLDTNASGCGTQGDTSVIQIYDFPVVVAYGDTTVCAGQPVNVYTNSAPNLTWSPTTGLNCAICTSNTVTPTQDISYIVTASIGSCVAKDTVDITVIPAPIPDAGLDLIVCQGDTANLVGNGANANTVCIWYQGNAVIDTACTVTVMPNFGTTSYVLSMIDTVNGCSDVDGMSVTVTSPPEIFGITPSGDSICIGTSKQLAVTVFGAADYSWTPTATLDNPSIANPLASPTTSTTYYVTVSAGSCSTSDSVVVHVTGTSVSAGADTSVCDGTAAVLHGSAGSAGSYSWAPAQSLTNPADQDALTKPLSNTTTFTLTFTESSSGCVATDEVVVDVHPLPNAGAGNDTAICLNKSATITAFGGSNYMWAPAEGLSNTNSASPNASPTVTTTYTVIVSDDLGCSGGGDVVVTVYSLPEVSTNAPTGMCPDATVGLGASSPNNVSYQWSPAESLNDPNAQFPVSSADVSTTYTVTVTDQNGCTATATQSVEIFGNPPLDAQPAVGELHLFSLEPVQISTNSFYDDYDWTPGFGLSDSTAASPTASPSVTTTYSVVAVSDDGCTAADTVIILVTDDAEIFLPNAFTPNGDGVNDLFRIRYEGTFMLEQFAIYDRWGKEIWSTGNESFDDGWTKGWDGTIGGTPAEVGSYTYVVRGKDQSNKAHQRQGNVTLLR